MFTHHKQCHLCWLIHSQQQPTTSNNNNQQQPTTNNSHINHINHNNLNPPFPHVFLHCLVHLLTSIFSGASVIKMAHAYLGAEAFRRFLSKKGFQKVNPGRGHMNKVRRRDLCVDHFSPQICFDELEDGLESVHAEAQAPLQWEDAGSRVQRSLWQIRCMGSLYFVGVSRSSQYALTQSLESLTSMRHAET